MEENVRAVRSYKKTPRIQVPEVPNFISPFLSQSALSLSNSGASPLVQSSPESLLVSSSSTLLLPPFSNLGQSSSQPRLIRVTTEIKYRNWSEKFKRMEEILRKLGLRLDRRISTDFVLQPHSCCWKEDPRGVAHGLAVARFLQGKTTIKMSDIIDLIYSHKHSAPLSRSTQYHERHAPFSPSVSAAEIKSMRVPSLFTWATNLVGNQVHQEIHKLTVEGPTTLISAHPLMVDAQKMASIWLLGRRLGKFSIGGLCEKYRKRAPVSWYSNRVYGCLAQERCCDYKVNVGPIPSYVSHCRTSTWSIILNRYSL
jgi:hypothetical protein